jgi:hypothetical protein
VLAWRYDTARRPRGVVDLGTQVVVFSVSPHAFGLLRGGVGLYDPAPTAAEITLEAFTAVGTPLLLQRTLRLQAGAKNVSNPGPAVVVGQK